MFDVIISGGVIADGSGAPTFRADIGIDGERIAEIGDLSESGARRVIDATGLTVSPGFIDTHAHSDGVLLLDPQHANGLRQGITTEILGQDGLSYAPMSAGNYRIYRRYLSGILGEPPEDLDMSSVAAFRSHYHGKVAINTAYNVPHAALRLETVGFRDVPLRGDAMNTARNMVRQGMEEGAVGFATGMSYHPNAWSDTDELVEICKVVAEYGGVYTTHLRDVNPDRGFGGGGVPEALEIGRRSGVKVHFSHYRTQPSNAGQVAEQMEMIDNAKAEGVDCTLDLYPYPTGSSFPLSFLPSDIHEGGPEAIMGRLRDMRRRDRLVRELESHPRRTLHDAVFTYMKVNKDLEGMSLPDIAEQRGTSLGETLINLLIEEDGQICYRGAPPDSVRVWDQVSRDAMELLSRPDYMVGSDAIPIGSMPHPPRIRLLSALPRQTQEEAPNNQPRTDRAEDDRQPGETVRPHRPRPHRERRLRGHRRLRRRSRHGQRHLRRSGAVPDRHPVRPSQRPGRRRQRALHRRPSRPGRIIVTNLARSGPLPGVEASPKCQPR